jgi:hypothetical protein
MAGSHSYRWRQISLMMVCLLLAATNFGSARGQALSSQYSSAAGSRAPGLDQQYLGAEAERPARYDEPPPPPFDGDPTWAPCQSLRMNRSFFLGHLYFGMDILGWATKGVHAPPLVTGSPIADGGIIGQGQTRILFGDDTFHEDLRPGGRLTFGWWFDPNQYSGVEFQYFELDGHNIRFDASGTNGSSNSILARPIIDAGTGQPNAVIIASDVLNGSVIATSNMQLTSTNILFRDLFWASQYARVDYLVGYRHTHLYDRLKVNESLTSLDDASGFAEGTPITRVDQFRAVNQFDGADLGLKGWWSRSGTLAVTGLAKVALGASNNNVIINGFTTQGSGRTATTTQGGVLALPSNIGRRAQQEFGVVSEIGCGLEWQPVCFWKFSLGYTWFYWSDVARAINQIDTTVDTSQLAPTSGSGASPTFHMHTTSFWAQGLNAGFSYQF